MSNDVIEYPSSSRFLEEDFFTPKYVGAYTANKKEVPIIVKNEPLLFVQGPPVFNKIIFKLEESTSVFTSIEDITTYEEVDYSGIGFVGVEKELHTITNNDILEKIIYLNRPFRKQVYAPLKFVMKEETLSGTLLKRDGNVIWIQPIGETEASISVDLHEVEDILWRGESFELF